MPTQAFTTLQSRGAAAIDRIPGRPSLALTWLSAFDPHDNGITGARLILASLVIVSHSVALAGLGLEPLVAETGASLGFFAVIAFFTLSGFLLARSRERTDVVPFVRNRLLRIMPGYWLALIFGAVVALAFGASLKGATDYVTSNLSLLIQGADSTEAFDGFPTNGPLWSLRVEMVAYIALVMIPRRWLRPVALGEFVILVALALDRNIADTALLLAFAFGVCAWLWRDRIPMVPLVAIPAFLVGNAVFWPLAVIACGYIGLAMARLPWRLDRDLSYGVYVLAYPVQVAMATAGLPLPVLVAGSFAVILPLAFLSWTFIESPALSLRGHFDASRRRASPRPVLGLLAALARGPR